MANPVQHITKYTGSIECLAGVPYDGSAFSLGNVMQMKTQKVKVIINSEGAGFDIKYDDVGYVDITATYTFSINCTIAFGAMVEVV